MLCGSIHNKIAQNGSFLKCKKNNFELTSVGVQLEGSSEAINFNNVVLPALSNPRRRIRISFSGPFFSFLNKSNKPYKWHFRSSHVWSRLEVFTITTYHEGVNVGKIQTRILTFSRAQHSRVINMILNISSKIFLRINSPKQLLRFKRSKL